MTRYLRTRMLSMNRLRGGLLLAATVAFSACDSGDPLGASGSLPASVTLATESPTVLTSLGDTALVRALVLDESGDPLHGVPLQWTTTPDGIVQVDDEGVLRAVGNGRVTVAAAVDLARTGVRSSGYWADRLADSLVLEVRQRPARLAIAAADTAFTSLGARRQLRAQVTDARGNALLDGPPPLTWRSADPRVVTVDSSGVVRSNGEGDARITLQADDLFGEAIFTVRPRLLHTSCMVFTQRRQTQQSCVTLGFVVREPEAGR
jgi:hypothetical protein